MSCLPDARKCLHYIQRMGLETRKLQDLLTTYRATKHPVKHHMGYPPSFLQSYETKSRTESLSMMLECYYWYQIVAYSGSSVVTCPLPTYRDPWDILVATCSLNRCSLSGEMLEPTSERLRGGRGRDGEREGGWGGEE